MQPNLGGSNTPRIEYDGVVKYKTGFETLIQLQTV